MAPNPSRISLLTGLGGDPGLLSVRAWRRLQEAEAAVVHPGVDPAVLAHLPEGAVRLAPGDPVGEYRRVVILHPGLFPPDAPPEAELVPSLPPELAAPLLAGLHLRDPSLLLEPDQDWDARADTRSSLVIPWDALEALEEAGLPPHTPAAWIDNPARPEQRSWTGSLQEARHRRGDLLVLGAPRARPAHYENRPLSGRRIAVTRARRQGLELAERLEDLGARAVVCPAIRFAPPQDPDPLRRAAREVHTYDWLIFTSANAVEPFLAALFEQGRDGRAIQGRLACIGPATARTLKERGLLADLIPATSTAEGLLEALEPHDMRGKRILLPRAQEAREVLPAALRERGAEVEVVAAYRTLPSEGEPGEVDLVAFTASSTVRGFHRLVEDPGRYPAAAIGPITAATARELGFPVRAVAREHTTDGLIRAILANLGGTPS